jgi:hypothetical protein
VGGGRGGGGTAGGRREAGAHHGLLRAEVLDRLGPEQHVALPSAGLVPLPQARHHLERAAEEHVAPLGGAADDHRVRLAHRRVLDDAIVTGGSAAVRAG